MSTSVTDYFGLQGRLILTQRDADGNIIESETFENTIVDAGLRHIARMLTGATTRAFGYIQIGSGGIGTDGEGQTYVKPTLPSNTTLHAMYTEGEAYRTVVQVNAVGTPGDHEYSPFVAIARFQHTFEFNEDVNINEAGIFSNVQTQTPTMLSHKTFWNRRILNGHALDVSWDIGITRFPRMV